MGTRTYYEILGVSRDAHWKKLPAQKMHWQKYIIQMQICKMILIQPHICRKY